MKLTDILKEIEGIKPEAFEETTGRRNVLKNVGMKIAAVATPFAAASFFSNKAAAKTTDVLSEAMTFLLKVGYMQSSLYTQALNTTGLIPAAAKADFTKILKDKNAHVAYWIYYLKATNNVVPAATNFNFTAKGALPKAYTDYNTFLTIAHAIEDAGVRMYLTGIKNLLTNKAFRTDAVNIATTNARHAAHVRLLRRNVGVEIMPWVAGTEANSIVGEIKKAYQQEDIVTQLKINTVGINGFDISFDAATEAFDEPMNEADALIFMQPFAD